DYYCAIWHNSASGFF
nr:immunoglobulin light chain junction region [Macaca mulatta]MOW17217.1 immunoglobulin light chain junction region [Macaca mulatta]